MLVGTGVQSELAAGRAKATREHVRVCATPGLAYAETGIIGAATTCLPYQAQHAFLAVRKMCVQPLREDVEELVRQTQKNVVRLVGSRGGHRLKDRFDFVVVDRRNDRRDQGTGRNAVFG